MTAQSVFSLSRFLQTVDGMVVGPAWTDHLGRELLRALRTARPAAPDSDLASPEDLAAAARVYHEVLSLSSRSAALWPIFANGKPQHSLFKEAVLAVAGFDEGALYALCRLDEREHLLAVNVARWLLQLPQQLSPSVVFVTPPGEAHAPRSRSATAREVAAVA